MSHRLVAALLALPLFAACAPPRPVLIQPTAAVVPSSSRISASGAAHSVGLSGAVAVRPVRRVALYGFGGDVSTVEQIRDADGGIRRRGVQRERGGGVSVRVLGRPGDDGLDLGLEVATGSTRGVGAAPGTTCPRGCGAFDPEALDLGGLRAERLRTSLVGAATVRSELRPLVAGRTEPATATVGLVARIGRQRLREVVFQPDDASQAVARTPDLRVGTAEYILSFRVRQEAVAAELQTGLLQRLDGGEGVFDVRGGFATVGVSLHLGR